MVKIWCSVCISIIVYNNHKLFHMSVISLQTLRVWDQCTVKCIYLMLHMIVFSKILHRRLIVFHTKSVYTLINFGNSACFEIHKTPYCIKAPGKSFINKPVNFYMARFLPKDIWLHNVLWENVTASENYYTLCIYYVSGTNRIVSSFNTNLPLVSPLHKGG